MPLTHSKLADIQYVANAAASLLANPASTKTYIRGITLFNGNTTDEIVKLYNVPDSGGSLGTAGVSNQFFELSMFPKETLFLEWQHPMVLSDTNDSIQGVTTTASKVTIQFHGSLDA